MRCLGSYEKVMELALMASACSIQYVSFCNYEYMRAMLWQGLQLDCRLNAMLSVCCHLFTIRPDIGR